MLAVVLVYFARYDLEALAESDFFIWLTLSGIVAFGWLVFICAQIAMKRDPLYDRIAGTAVIIRPRTG